MPPRAACMTKTRPLVISIIEADPRSSSTFPHHCIPSYATSPDSLTPSTPSTPSSPASVPPIECAPPHHPLRVSHRHRNAVPTASPPQFLPRPPRRCRHCQLTSHNWGPSLSQIRWRVVFVFSFFLPFVLPVDGAADGCKEVRIHIRHVCMRCAGRSRSAGRRGPQRPIDNSVSYVVPTCSLLPDHHVLYPYFIFIFAVVVTSSSSFYFPSHPLRLAHHASRICIRNHLDHHLRRTGLGVPTASSSPRKITIRPSPPSTSIIHPNSICPILARPAPDNKS
ncbi:hypothetical protein K439DRAFT_774293 [Ramaria rubella]|nr:hypothetical protein K439DRAFT_774293 [Ramaria rubella]